MSATKFKKFLETVDLKGYREKYRYIKIVEVDLPKDIQAIELLYKVYWGEKKFLKYDAFNNRYLKEKSNALDKFRRKITVCENCFKRGLEVRVYRIWASLETQIHAGYSLRKFLVQGQSLCR